MEHDLRNPNPYLFLWWYAYNMAMTVRFVQPFAGSASVHVENLAATIAGTLQGVSVSVILSKAYRSIPTYEPKRVPVLFISSIAWIADTIDFFTSRVRGPASTAISITMIAAYELRAHLMMFLGIAGVSKFDRQ